ncbi:integrase [Mycobacterium sp. E2327]|uniref:tyrosine-type recombinase/integrase n=1 Tax=Mycobacterium sp. E2327 TaxID=1834132 RepID=UPI0007FCB822|nr:site-specific integrase [Mycobacterium sp. E2327]OBI11151.1 integrase [Mycobacterium sp. E2327]
MSATIRKRVTGQLDKFGNPVVSYQVRWREPLRDEFGAPALDADGKPLHKSTGKTFPTERKAKAHARKVDNALESASHINPSDAQAKANTPLGVYARQYLDSLAGTVDPTTIQGYEKLYRTHIAPVFGSKPVAAITTAQVERWRASLLQPYRRSFVTRGKATPKRKQPPPALVVRSPKTVKHIVGTLKRILDTALKDQAIPANPVLSTRRTSTKRLPNRSAPGSKPPFAHRPLTGAQVAAVADYIATQRHNRLYGLVVTFAAYTGVRAAELQGLQVGDVTLSDIPGTVGAVRIRRTKTKAAGGWIDGTPKTAKSDRVVPLAPWLADDLRHYLTTVHPFAGHAEGCRRIAHAPLFPGKRTRAGKAAVDIADFDWAKPMVVDNLYHNYFQPACKALGLGPVRFHDLRHTFATLALSAGEHYMQVSKWLGHSSYVLTLSTYADYIREDDTAAPAFTRPVADAPRNVVSLGLRKTDTA